MSIENSNNQPAVDMSNIAQKEEKKVNILPPAILAAKFLNKKNTIGQIEVDLPVLNKKVKCNPISGINETIIKTISGSITSYNDANFRLLYSHLEFEPECNINSYEEFLLKFNEADFRTALYGVMKASFKQLEENSFECKNKDCPNPNDNKIFNFTPLMKDIKITFPREAFVSPSNDHTKDLFVAENGQLTINYKFDSMATKIKLFKPKSNEEIRKNILNTGMMLPKNEITTSYIDSITVKGDDEVFEITSQADITLFINSLDVTSREEVEKLNNRFINHIDGWVPSFSTTVKCPHCGKTQEWEDIDIYVEFFRKFTAIF